MQLIVRPLLDRHFDFNLHSFVISPRAAEHAEQFFAGNALHSDRCFAARGRERHAEYRAHFGQALLAAASQLKGRERPVVTFLGPGKCEREAIGKLARMGFSVQLISAELSAIEAHHGQKPPPGFTYRERELTGGLVEALFLVGFSLQHGPDGVKLSPRDCLMRFYKQLLQICRSFSTEPDEEAVERFGGAADLVVSGRVVGAIANSVDSLVPDLIDELAGGREALTQLFIKDALENPKLHLAKIFDERVRPALEELRCKIFLHHARTLVACSRAKEGLPLFADTIRIPPQPTQPTLKEQIAALFRKSPHLVVAHPPMELRGRLWIIETLLFTQGP